MPHIEAGLAAESHWTLFTFTHNLHAGRLRRAAPIFAMPFHSNGAANLTAVMLLPHAPFYLVLEIPGWVSVQILDRYESILIQAAIQPDLGVSMG